ncbi:oligosaccharide flippase family protein [Halalkalicoccus jeotgali]|uniref:Polysaccharide biosynthesis protein n=1 Tax=Halalkalicoccus jeotgali (strain DSM 18796 / CECT 7217 / JCM 14584 / KCTC 4019 / B3) TaxID=795797 RepID=D8J5S8_HALJB|nr:oligosaccharide flippase family protein [Halalkalicoccus jeotgali]ADJ13734.1 polysaccharide biosynthesis protein [Halalkalicoccus jeotgali B3]ELY34220.1 polysaccharide biosynthesis protein [Halalkalicoccus jeotgali B3]
MKRTLITAFLSIAGANVAGTFVGALMTPVLVRILGPSQYGTYATVMSVFAILMIAVSSGVDSGTRKYLAEDREDPDWHDNVFGFYFRLATAFALAASALLLAAAQTGLIDATLGEDYAQFFFLLAVVTIMAQFREYTRRSLLGLKLEHLSEPLFVAQKVFFFVFAISFAYLGYGVSGVLMGHILGDALVTVIGFIGLSRHVSFSAIFERPPESFPRRELLSFNNLSIVYIFLLTSLYHVDILMLQAYTTEAQVGYYKAALVLAEFLWLAPKAVQSVMIQSASELWHRDRIERITSLASKATRYTLLLTALLAIGIAVLATKFVPRYYGAAFEPTITPLLLLLPGTVGFAVARPILSVSHARGDMRIMILATGGTAVMNLLLNVALIPRFGIEGAAIATSLGYLSLPMFHLWGARTIGYNPLGDIRPIRISTTVAITGAVLLGLALGIDALIQSPLATVGLPLTETGLPIDAALIAFVVVPPTGLIVYGVLTLVTRAIDPSEVTQILRGLPGPLGRHASTIQRLFGGTDETG